MTVVGRGRRAAAAGTVVGVVLIAAGIVWVIAVRFTDSSQAADQEASVFGVILAALGAIATLVGWFRSRGPATPYPTAEQVDQAAATLAGLVRERWTAEARTRLLFDPEPMPVRWELANPDLMDHPELIVPDGPLEFSGRSHRLQEIVDAFERLPARRLVITGGRGTGKTTLALQLLLGLLPPPGTPLARPVPVMFSLYSWDPDVHPQIEDWLAGQIAQDYPGFTSIHPRIAAALAAQGRLLPILDGFDELPADRATRVLVALNGTSGTTGLIVTSRRPEYRAAVWKTGRPLRRAAAIGPEPLSAADVADYLRKHLPPRPAPGWERLIAALHDSGADTQKPLAAFLSTPLGLWLLRAVYVDTDDDPSPLLDPSRYPTLAAVRTHLLESLIPALVASRSSPATGDPRPGLRPLRYRADDLRTWLTTIAVDLRETASRDWRWWELCRHTFPTRRDRVVLRTVTAVAFGLPFAVVLAPFVGLFWAIAFDPIVAFSVAGAVVLAGGLSCGAAMVRRRAVPRDLNLRGRRRPRRHEVLVAVALGAAAWLLSTIFVGLAVTTIFLLQTTETAAQAVSPAESLRGDRNLARMKAAVYGVLLAVIPGVVVGVGIGGSWGVTAGLLAGVAYALLAGLVFGPTVGFVGSAWIAFVAAIVRQRWRARRSLPRPSRVMPMLEDCHRLGLLRAVGPAYQFRHAELQDHLAAPPATGPEPDPAATRTATRPPSEEQPWPPSS